MFMDIFVHKDALWVRAIEILQQKKCEFCMPNQQRQQLISTSALRSYKESLTKKLYEEEVSTWTHSQLPTDAIDTL